MTTTITSKQLQEKTDEQLAEFMAGWKELTGNYILCKMEFQRRQNSNNNIRGWISLGVSLFALIVSVAAFLVR